MIDVALKQKLSTIVHHEDYSLLVKNGPAFHKVKKTKEYVPTKKTLSKLILSEDEVKDIIKIASPYSKEPVSPLNEVDNMFRLFLNKITVFTKSQVNRMEEKTKELIVQTFFNSFTEHATNNRHLWLGTEGIYETRNFDVVSETYYEENKLKLEVLNKQFYILHTECIEELENECLMAIFKITHEIIRTGDFKKRRYHLEEDCINIIWIKALQLVPYAGYTFYYLRELYLNKLRKGMKEEEIREYKRFKMCPLEGFLLLHPKTGYPLTNNHFFYMEAVLIQFQTAVQILKTQEIEYVLERLLFLVEQMMMEEPENNLSTLEKANLMRIVRKLPEIYDVLDEFR